MIQFRDVIVFLAGAQAFHTLTHILFPLFFSFPVEMKHIKIKFTREFNLVAILINFIVTVALIMWAVNLSPKFHF